jgi:hypothetical protein
MRFENRRDPKIKNKMFYKLEKVVELKYSFQWRRQGMKISTTY